MPPRRRQPLDRAQLAPLIRQPGPSPLAEEMRIDPSQWALVVCVGRDGKAQVHGRRTGRAAEALRMVADEIERLQS